MDSDLGSGGPNRGRGDEWDGGERGGEERDRRGT
jgi:hypothetical protein